MQEELIDVLDENGIKTGQILSRNMEDAIIIENDELFVSVLCTKTKFKGPTYAIVDQEFHEIKKTFTEILKNRGINIFFLGTGNIKYFGHMHAVTFIYDDVDLEQLIKIYKNYSKCPKEITDLIWNEDFICKIANINNPKKILKKMPKSSNK